MYKDKILDVCDKLTALSFYLLVLGITFSNALTEIATASIIALWIIGKILKKDYSLPGGILSILLVLLSAWTLASFINTGYMHESIRGLFKVIKHAALFMATIDYFRTRARIERLVYVMFGVAFFICLNGILQYIIGTDLIRHRTIDPYDYLHRVSSSFRHANDFGAYLVVIIPLLMSLIFSKGRSLKMRIMLSVVLLPAFWCLVTTDSRGAWIGFLIALLYMAFMRSKKLFVIILILLLASPLFMPHSIKDRFSDISTINSGGTIWERIKLWSGTADMVRDHPVLGVGVNTYTKNFPKYKPADYPDVRYTHNSYLHMAAETGIVGAGIFIAFLLILVFTASRSIRLHKDPLERDLSLGLLAGVIGFLAHCVVDTHLYSVVLSAFIFMCLGLTVSLRRMADGK
ncbi:MAG: O-antigen ligase family protein [Candidatus Omnitrophica bacterium]|nr:O-antigen ligase family protein [Candidatus Omnitrophota bacterium]